MITAEVFQFGVVRNDKKCHAIKQEFCTSGWVASLLSLGFEETTFCNKFHKKKYERGITLGSLPSVEFSVMWVRAKSWAISL